jgi:hypothetical protein
MAGGDSSIGTVATGDATGVMGGLVAGVDPAALVAVTLHVISWPTSAAVNVYWLLAVGPLTVVTRLRCQVYW